MASNDVSQVVPLIFAQGVQALRNSNIMTRLVNADYSTDAQAKGDTVNIPIPSAITAAAITPAATAPNAGAASPTKAQIQLSNWWEAAFDLSDKEIGEAVAGIVPGQVSEAVAAIVDKVNSTVLDTYSGIYGYVGAAGTTPFSVDIDEGVEANRVLNEQKCPRGMRRVVLDPTAEAKALKLKMFTDASARGSDEALRTGQLGSLLGMDWYSDQQVPTHTAGTASGATTDSAGYALGVKTVTLASAGTGTILAGDVITFAGDTQTYVVTTGDSDVSNGGTISFEPGLQVAIPASTTAITLKASHVVNLAFHRDAIGFASRILADGGMSDADRQNVQQVADPVSGLTLRLERRREHYRTRWSFSALWGVTLVRRELACRIAG